jgi:type IV secretion system protein TrbC
MTLPRTLDALRRTGEAALLFTLAASLALPAHAAGNGVPWEGPLDQILASIEGPVARIVAVIIITLTGLTLAFGETSGGFRKLIQIVFGLSIAFAATSFLLTFFFLRRRGAGLMVTTGLPQADET